MKTQLSQQLVRAAAKPRCMPVDLEDVKRYVKGYKGQALKSSLNSLDMIFAGKTTFL